MKKKSSLTDSMERLLLFLTPRAGLAKMFLLINISFIQIFFSVRIGKMRWKMIIKSFILQAYFCLSTCMIILSIFGVAISTLPEFRLKDQPPVAEVTAEPITTLPPPPDYCKLLYEKETAILNSPKDTTIATNSSTEIGRTFIEKIFPEPVHTKIPSLKQTLDRGTNAFFIIEIITTVFFTIEQVLLLISGPRLVSHFMNAMNFIEMLLLLASYCRFSLHFLELEYEDNGWSLLLYVQMFRVLRIVRVMRHVTAFKVLNYSISAGKKDLCIIILYIFMGIVIFSNLIFFFELSEDFHSIPDAWWWTLITMTTVGYGDMIPKTIAGKVLGCVCAVSGVIMLSLVIPIFVNTFLFLYQYAELESVNIPAPKKRCTASRTSTSGDTEITVDPE